ncbi:MAG: DNA-3-methyladenine glycosylase I [Bacteroidales bacterium]|nr:DNA-3-methyladenine glycosylase I [Bacteroidales bacterium]
MDEHKCQWCQDNGLLEHYHDTEWGIPCHADRMLFEYLTLEAMSCGLSWLLMLQKREIFRDCFGDFDYKKVAEFTESDINRAMKYPGMIKSRRKIEAIISNAKCFMLIQQEFGSFDKYLWDYSEGKTFIYQSHLGGIWLTKNDLSDKIAADLKNRGFKFLGSTLIYSYLQSVGIINDHAPECWMFEKIGGTIV